VLVHGQGFLQGDLGDRSPLLVIQGGYHLINQLEFFGNFSGFENLITLTLSGILRHLVAELSILRCIKLIRGLYTFF
jgi:hypothetical protein